METTYILRYMYTMIQLISRSEISSASNDDSLARGILYYLYLELANSSKAMIKSPQPYFKALLWKMPLTHAIKKTN